MEDLTPESQDGGSQVKDSSLQASLPMKKG